VRKQGNKAPVIGKPKLDEDPKVVAKKLLDDLTSIDTPFNKQITPENLSQVRRNLSLSFYEFYFHRELTRLCAMC